LFKIAYCDKIFKYKNSTISNWFHLYFVTVQVLKLAKVKLKSLRKMNFSRVIGFAYFFVVLALICHFTEAVPKQYEGSSEKWVKVSQSEIISLLKFIKFSGANNWRRRSANETESSASDRTQRLGSLHSGTTAYGNSLGGYGGYGGVGTYGKGPIDLGGVVLGTLIGIGAILILPKIVSVFSGQGGYGGGYYRSKIKIILWNRSL
jgi:hypothetical protein